MASIFCDTVVCLPCALTIFNPTKAENDCYVGFLHFLSSELEIWTLNNIDKLMLYTLLCLDYGRNVKYLDYFDF